MNVTKSMSAQGRKRAFGLFESGPSTSGWSPSPARVCERQLPEPGVVATVPASDRFECGPVSRPKNRRRQLWVARSPSPCELRCDKADIELRRREAAVHVYRLPATSCHSRGRKITSPITGLEGTAYIARRTFAVTESRKRTSDETSPQVSISRPRVTGLELSSRRTGVKLCPLYPETGH